MGSVHNSRSDQRSSNRLRYYVWSLDVKDTVILIPEVQLKGFLAELNEAFPNEILDPVQSDAYCRERTLLVDFPEHPRT